MDNWVVGKEKVCYWLSKDIVVVGGGGGGQGFLDRAVPSPSPDPWHSKQPSVGYQGAATMVE